MRDYTNYNSSLTIAYKQGYIHTAYLGSIEVVRVSVDQYAYAIEVKSIRAAKQAITRYMNKVK
jgi:hypothetical protein